jgi:hypothetical protein
MSSRRRRGSLSLTREALLTQVVTAGPELLSFGMDPETRLNPLALTEVTFEFARFFLEQVLPRLEPRASSWALIGGMSDLHEGGHVNTLVSGQINGRWSSESEPAPDNDFTFGPLRFSSEPAGAVTYRALVEIYSRFGLAESQIGYAQNGAIDAKLF